MSREKILIVEDEADIAELIDYNLRKEGYRTTCVDSGEEALRAVRREVPDLVVLDLMLPGVDGLEVCRSLKNDSRTKSLPILMLTAKSEEPDIVTGLEMGADDYMAKPFSPRVLVARIRALLRRNSQSADDESSVLRVHDVVIDPTRHEVLVAGKVVDLSLTEFRVLAALARRPGWALTRSQIVQAVHVEDYAVTDRSVDVQIVGLRKKLGHAGEYIETVRGIGYRFKE